MRTNPVFFWQAGWLFALVVAALLLSACQPAATSTQAVPVTGETPVVILTQAEPANMPTAAPTAAPTEAAAPTLAPTQAQTSESGSGDDDYGYSDGTGSTPSSGRAPDEIKLTIRQDPALGRYLADEQGMTLYLFTKDTPGMSACEGDCLAKWPPLLVAQGGEVEIDGMDEEGIIGTITRSDGSLQVTYKDLPLYYWVNDTRPGETTGQGVGGVWFVVEP